jgi:O-antigen/teichoic acid export membrane protein
VLVAALSVLDLLPRLLGVAHVAGVSVAVVGVVLINVVARPAMLALAALQGLGHSVAVVLLQVAVPVVALGVVVVAALLNAPLAVFAASVMLGQLACGIGALVMVSRRYRLPVLTSFVPGPADTRVSMRSQAGPMLVINLVGPLGVGLDRISLAHLSTPVALASYALVAQLLQPVYSLNATLNQSLWGDFSRKRHEGLLSWATVRGPLMVVGIGAVTCLVGFAVATPWVAHLLADGTITVGHDLGTLAGGVALLLLLGAVPGALLTTAAGLTFQAKVLVISVAINLALTWALSPSLGAAGPLLGSVVGLGVQCVILARLVRRDLRETRAGRT